MEHLKRRSPTGDLDFTAVFPHHAMTANQREAFRLITKWNGRVTLELPTGSGKTAVGYTFLRALAETDQGPLFYICPTKTLVDQVHRLHPDLVPMYGRREYDCLYYPGESRRADEIPCLLLDCQHRVDQSTGEVQASGVTPCPYYLAKFKAKQSAVVVCTVAFYLYHILFRSGLEWEEPAGLVIDEVHDLTEAVRQCLRYDISDDHLYRAADLLSTINGDAAETLHQFRNKMVHIIKRRSRRPEVILSDAEIVDLLLILNNLDDRTLERDIRYAVRNGVFDPMTDLVALKQLDTIVRGLRRYIRSLEFCLETDQRHALNYTYATWREELSEKQRSRYILTVGSYYVAPLIRKMLAPRTVAFSATIGQAQVFEEVTGIKAPVEHLGSDFPHQHTRIFLPKDSPNLAFEVRRRNRNTLNRALRMMVKACQRFARAGHRSLVAVVSERERSNFVRFAEEAGLDAISYGNGVPAKEAATRFRNGESFVLVGTAAQFGQGLDLPDQTAPVIFFLRPGYPSPYDPESQFEERRFRKHVWKQRKWRAMIEALQVRGRNIRSRTDKGVTFFVSQQFGDFLYGSLPEWLQPAYCGNKTFDECVEDTLTLLKQK